MSTSQSSAVCRVMSIIYSQFNQTQKRSKFHCLSLAHQFFCFSSLSGIWLNFKDNSTQILQKMTPCVINERLGKRMRVWAESSQDDTFPFFLPILLFLIIKQAAVNLLKEIGWTRLFHMSRAAVILTIFHSVLFH